jgi:hypothetical protein
MVNCGASRYSGKNLSSLPRALRGEKSKNNCIADRLLGA